MIGLPDSTHPDVSPEGSLPQGHAANVVCMRSRSFHEATWRPGGKEPMTMLTTIQSAATPSIRRSALLLMARLRRFINGWVAAALAHREQQAALFALRQSLSHCKLDDTRIYRGPIDAAFEKTAQLRERRRYQVTRNQTIAMETE